jgi:hypothetical protein
MSAVHLVCSCAACRKVLDDRWDGSDGQKWCTLVEFLRRYRAFSDEVMLFDGYCPDCELSYDRLMQYGQAHNMIP